MKISTRRSLAGSLMLLLFVFLVGWSRALPQQQATSSAQRAGQGSPVTVPSRPSTPLYKGEQGTQQSEIQFVPLSRTVTIKFLVEDPNGYFLPNIRRDNFAVYEDGVRQQNVTVEVEHSPVSVALLIQFGGRYHELNQALALEIAHICHEFLSVIGRDDKVAVFKYGSKVELLVDFNQGHDAIEKALDKLGTPGFSELNFYDALLETLNRVREVSGRRAVIAISSGLDTFSQANYQQTLQQVRESAIPTYTIGLLRMIQREAAVYGSTAPFARIDWSDAEKQLEALARASGGRAYVPESDLELPAIFDDIMENLRVRYVVTYVSSNPATSGPPRNIRVELIDSKTGEPLKIHDSTGKLVAEKVYVQANYIPKGATGD
jgi:Ca-activated chloride channel family protein